MSFEDKSIKCLDCGQDFTFSAEDQEFFQAKGFTNEPKRCLPCRQAKKAERNGGRHGRQMYPAVCSECGSETEVPFQPTGMKPVYCNDCFRKIRSVS